MTEKVGRIRSNVVWNRWKSTLRAKPELENGNINTVYFINHARGNTRISRTEFDEFVYDPMNEHAIANV